MKLSNIFIGQPAHWAFLGMGITMLVLLGLYSWHFLYFNLFTGIVFSLGFFEVLFAVLTYREGYRVTRDPIDV